MIANAVTMAGTVRELARAEVTVADAAVLALTVEVPEGEMLAYTWADAAGQNRGGDHFAPKPYKTYDLEPSKLIHSVKTVGQGFEITVEAAALALFVALEADQPGRFSVNGFALFPGHPATVTFTPDAMGDKPGFTLRDLYSATYGTL